MLELQLLGVECLSAERRGCVFSARSQRGETRLEAATVNRIAQNRMADMREMHADLMRAAGLEDKSQHRNVAGRPLAGKSLKHVVMRCR